MKPIDAVIERLQKVRKYGNRYTAICPCHTEKTPSLSITEGSDGRVLMHCFGCAASYRDLMAAIGLDESAGFVGERTYQGPKRIPRSAILLEVNIIRIYEADPHEADRQRYELACNRIRGAIEE